MKRYKKRDMLQSISMLKKANDAVVKTLHKAQRPDLEEALAQCQETAILLGTYLETQGEEGISLVHMLEDYCENIYQMSQSLEDESACRKISKKIQKQLVQVENGIKFRLPDRREVVFLPYKASMWDSLESVWMAADQDENCDAYVIPIPYYDKNPDGTFKEEHYEADLFPDYVPITNYEEYNFEERRPDAVFIHNPYDQYNFVTSVHPFFYSSNLKQYTDTLVYIPYYATAGGMSEAQSQCVAYYYVDYIVIQTEKYRKYFAEDISDEKFLPFGSPKFDRVIRLCNNPPQPPETWVSKMEGKMVYFYNTSLNGMLANTAFFLKKMEYVFKCFQGRDDACLVWRPHPLMESTFTSMRAEYKPVYDALKKYYIENNVGIYDDTPDIANTIALCDAYIGDAGTSVTSLFGIAGKPLFILDNNIHTEPTENDWRGKIIRGFFPYGNDEWMVTQGNKLYRAENMDYHYRYFCDLSEYTSGDYYLTVIRVGDRDYVCPANAQDILLIGEHGIEDRIALEQYLEQSGAFGGAIVWEQYLFLIPNNYPYLVRLDTLSGQVSYWNDNMDIFIRDVRGEKRIGGYCVQNGYLYLFSPVDDEALKICIDTGNTEVIAVGALHMQGCLIAASDGKEVWLVPYDGTTVVRWNPETGELREYSEYPVPIICKHPIIGYECKSRPFSFPAFSGDKAYFAPIWGEKFIEIDKNTDEIYEWKPDFPIVREMQNDYFMSWQRASFIRTVEESDKKEYLLYSDWDRKLYRVNLETQESVEIDISFDMSELSAREPGFSECSQWLQYACEENALNSLSDFLNSTIKGEEFSKERQIRAFGTIAENHDGTCGKHIYQFVKNRMEEL